MTWGDSARYAARVDVLDAGGGIIASTANPASGIVLVSGSIDEDLIQDVTRICSLRLLLEDRPDGSLHPLMPVMPTDPLDPRSGGGVIIHGGPVSPSGAEQLVQLGVYRITAASPASSREGQSVSLRGMSYESLISSVPFRDTYNVAAGTLVTTAIREIAAGAIPGLDMEIESSPTTLPTSSWSDRDNRMTVVGELAASLGMVAKFDRAGRLRVGHGWGSTAGPDQITVTVTANPSIEIGHYARVVRTPMGVNGIYQVLKVTHDLFGGESKLICGLAGDLSTPRWDLIEGPNSVVRSVTREISEIKAQAFNGVTVVGEPRDSLAIDVRAERWDTDPRSPTFYDPYNPGASRIGPQPYKVVSPIVRTQQEAENLAEVELRRKVISRDPMSTLAELVAGNRVAPMTRIGRVTDINTSGDVVMVELETDGGAGSKTGRWLNWGQPNIGDTVTYVDEPLQASVIGAAMPSDEIGRRTLTSESIATVLEGSGIVPTPTSDATTSAGIVSGSWVIEAVWAGGQSAATFDVEDFIEPWKGYYAMIGDIAVFHGSFRMNGSLYLGLSANDAYQFSISLPFQPDEGVAFVALETDEGGAGHFTSRVGICYTSTWNAFANYGWILVQDAFASAQEQQIVNFQGSCKVVGANGSQAAAELGSAREQAMWAAAAAYYGWGGPGYSDEGPGVGFY